MIGALIQLIVYLIIAGIIYWGATAILALLPLPDPFKRIIQILLIVICCLIVVYALYDLVIIAGLGRGPLLR